MLIQDVLIMLDVMVVQEKTLKIRCLEDRGYSCRQNGSITSRQVGLPRFLLLGQVSISLN